MVNKKNIRRNKKRRKDILGIFIITIVLAIIVTSIYSYQKLTSKHQIINKETFCSESGPSEIIAVLIDRTDKLNVVQQRAIEINLEDLRENLPIGAELSIYIIRSISDDLLKPIFKMCNPGRGKEVNPFLGNPKLIEKRWRESFNKPLQSAYDSLLSIETEDRSPIMESIQSVALTNFSGKKFDDVSKKLIIISDMLQNTKSFSNYSKGSNFEALRKNQYYKQVYTNLNNLNVNILYIRRNAAHKIQGQKHIKFWQEFFSDQGATLTRVVSIEG
jgi:hypothetical protein